MKKRKLLSIIISASMLLGSAFAFLFKLNYQEVKADDNPLQEIGVLYKIQHVSSLTKVYISASEIDFYNSIGRTVYVEYGFPPLNPPTGLGDNPNYNPPDNPPVQTPYYYYYADAMNPILTDWKMLYNDVDSLIFAIEYLEEEFAYYNSNANIKNAVLSYIRGIDIRYFVHIINLPANLGQINLQNIICGDPNVMVILGYEYPTGTTYTYEYQFLDSYYLPSNGIKVRDFFVSFLEDATDYNSDYYGVYSSDETTFLSKHLRLINPASNNANIDLLHMFDSMDGNFAGTGQYTPYSPYNVVSENVYRYVVSWAGDLQQATKKYSIAQNQPELLNFSQILNGDFDFDYCDFYADLDAVNMAFGVDLGIDTRSISEIVDDYYSQFDDPTFCREVDFCHKIAYAAFNHDIFDFTDFSYVIRLMMNLNMSGNQLYDPSLPASIVMHYFLDDINITLLPFVYEVNQISTSYRLMMTSYFCNYFLQFFS